jgi:Tfp pilus assembly protein PilX
MEMNPKAEIRLRGQRGIAMMVALLALVLLAAIGMGLMFMADTENSVNNNYRDSQKAYFAARAGAEHVRLLLTNGAVLNAQAMALDGVMPKSGVKNMMYVLNPTNGEAIDPLTGLYQDDQLCWEKYTNLGLTAGTGGRCGANGATGQILTSNSSFSANPLPQAPGVNGSDALPFKWVRIANKQNLMGPLGRTTDGTSNNGLQVCWNGSKEFAIPSGQTCAAQAPQPMMPVWLLTSLAVTPGVGQSPGSRRVVQMEVALNPPINPPGAVAAKAPINLQGNLQVNGYDNCSCTSTNTDRPGKVCDKSHLAVFSHNGVSQTGNAADLYSGLGNGLTQYDSNGNVTTQGATSQNQDWPYDVDNLISNYKQSAQNASGGSWNFNCTGNPSDCGTQSGDNFGDFPGGLPDSPSYGQNQGPATVYVPGSVHLSGNASGSGILIIDGDLEVHGGLAFYGLILVKGQISFTGGGSQKINLYGAILAGQDVNAQDVAMTDTIGGSFNFHYDSCALKLMPSIGPPKLLATHEITY